MMAVAVLVAVQAWAAVLSTFVAGAAAVDVAAGVGLDDDDGVAVVDVHTDRRLGDRTKHVVAAAAQAEVELVPAFRHYTYRTEAFGLHSQTSSGRNFEM